MIIKELLTEVNIITKKNKINPKFQLILKNKPNIQALLNAHFAEMNVDIKTAVRMVLDDQLTQPTCKMCNVKTAYNFYRRKFNTYCSHKCSQLDPNNVKKGKQTKLMRYGSENYNNKEQGKLTKAIKRNESIPRT